MVKAVFPMRYVYIDGMSNETIPLVRLFDLAMSVLKMRSYPECWARYKNLHPAVLQGGLFPVFSSTLENYQSIASIGDLWKLSELSSQGEKELLLVDENWAKDVILAHEAGVVKVDIVTNNTKVRYAWKHHHVEGVCFKNAIGYSKDNEMVPCSVIGLAL